MGMGIGTKIATSEWEGTGIKKPILEHLYRIE